MAYDRYKGILRWVLIDIKHLKIGWPTLQYFHMAVEAMAHVQSFDDSPRT